MSRHCIAKGFAALCVTACLAAPAWAGAPGATLPQAHQHHDAASYTVHHAASHGGRAAHDSDRLYGATHHVTTMAGGYHHQHHTVGHHATATSSYCHCAHAPAVVSDVTLPADFFFGSGGVGAFEHTGPVGGGVAIISGGQSFGGGVLGSRGRSSLITRGWSTRHKGGHRGGHKGGHRGC